MVESHIVASSKQHEFWTYQRWYLSQCGQNIESVDFVRTEVEHDKFATSNTIGSI